MRNVNSMKPCHAATIHKHLTAQTPLTDYGKDTSCQNVETGYGILPFAATVPLIVAEEFCAFVALHALSKGSLLYCTVLL